MTRAREGSMGEPSASAPRLRPLSSRSFRSVLGILVNFVAWFFPLAVWALHDYPKYFPLLIVLLFLLITYKLRRLPPRMRWVFGVVLLALAAAMGVVSSERLLRLYPFLMSTSALLIFWQARRPEDNPMLGPLRRWRPATADLLADLHQAKRIWVVGLTGNSLVFFAFLFLWDTKAWMLYATLYSYLLLGSLMVLTWVYLGLLQWRRKR